MMKKICAIICIIATLILSSLCLFGCEEKNPEPQSRVFYEYFDTVCAVSDYSGDESFDARVSEIEATLERYHKLLDIYDEYDGTVNLATLNRLAGQGWIEVEEELVEFLLYAKDVHAITGGEVNVAMGAVLSIWHEYREAGESVPTADMLTAASEHINIDSLEIDAESKRVRITDPQTSLDAGALAKGYVAAVIRAELEADGVSGYVLDLGGNLCVVGTKPDGSGWSTGVQSPDGYGYAHRFTLSDASAVTSGNYERFYIVDGKLYHHIIDRDSLMPAEGYSSVTVITGEDALADAFSTSLFCMSYEEGCALLSRIPDARCVWVTDSGEVLTYGFED